MDPDDTRYDDLPDDYLQSAKHVTTPVHFMTGADSRVFTDSNIVCHRELENVVPGQHELYVAPGYGHQDVLTGMDCARDIFPRLGQFLKDKQR